MRRLRYDGDPEVAADLIVRIEHRHGRELSGIRRQLGTSEPDHSSDGAIEHRFEAPALRAPAQVHVLARRGDLTTLTAGAVTAGSYVLVTVTSRPQGTTGTNAGPAPAPAGSIPPHEALAWAQALVGPVGARRLYAAVTHTDPAKWAYLVFIDSTGRSLTLAAQALAALPWSVQLAGQL